MSAYENFTVSSAMIGIGRIVGIKNFVRCETVNMKLGEYLFQCRKFVSSSFIDQAILDVHFHLIAQKF